MRQPCMVRRCASQVSMRLRRTWCRKRCCCCGQSATGLEASPMLQAMPSACCTMCSVRRYGVEDLRPPTSARHAMPRLRPMATSRTYSFLFRNFQNEMVENRDGVHARDIEELPYDEIARLVGMSEGNVRVHLCRTRRMLRKLWQREI